MSDELQEMRSEVTKARAEGYPVVAVERLLAQAEAALRDHEADAALERVRRANGMLISLKLPRWAHDMRFATTNLPDFQHTAPTYRDAVNLGRDWGEWYCVARPTLEAQERLAVEVKARFPEKRLSILAYVSYTQPPEKERPAPGLDVSYAFFTRNWFTDPIGNADGPMAKGPYAFDIARKHLARWAELTRDGGGNVMMYEYYAGRGAWQGRPYPLMHLIPQELAYFEKIGLAGCAVQAHWNSRKTDHANLYAFAKAAWDTKLDVDAALADYYPHRYGKAAGAMAKYFAQMEENARHLQKYFVRGSEAVARRDKGLADAEQFLSEAKALADTDWAKQLITEEHSLFEAYRKFQFAK